MCAACRTRYGGAPPLRERRVAAVPADAASPAAEPASPGRERRSEEHEDRVKRALGELPRGEHSTGRIAKAATAPSVGRRVKAIARDALATLTRTLDDQRCP